jgi:hypothetical protein
MVGHRTRLRHLRGIATILFALVIGVPLARGTTLPFAGSGSASAATTPAAARDSSYTRGSGVDLRRLRRIATPLISRLWKAAALFYPRARKQPLTRIVKGGPYAMTVPEDTRYKIPRQTDISPNLAIDLVRQLRPRATRGLPETGDYVEDAVPTLLHEWAHYFQSNRLTHGPVWLREGGAEAFAYLRTRQTEKRLGLKHPSFQFSVPQYKAWALRVLKEKGKKWVLNGQFGPPYAKFAKGRRRRRSMSAKRERRERPSGLP